MSFFHKASSIVHHSTSSFPGHVIPTSGGIHLNPFKGGGASGLIPGGANPFSALNDLSKTILSPLTNLTKGLGEFMPMLIIGAAAIGGIMLLKK